MKSSRMFRYLEIRSRVDRVVSHIEGQVWQKSSSDNNAISEKVQSFVPYLIKHSSGKSELTKIIRG